LITLNVVVLEAEVQFAFGDGHRHFPPLDLRLQMGVGVVPAGVVAEGDRGLGGSLPS